MAAPAVESRGEPWLRPLLAGAVVGTLLRAVILLAAGELELQSDETRYVYLALHWNHFGYYADTHRYLWPPGYAWLLAHAMALFGYGGLTALRVFQVLTSPIAGLAIAGVAQLLFGARAAKAAIWIWALHLPLIGFTHELRTESLFLVGMAPALWLVLGVWQQPEREPGLRLALAGTCFAGALYLKEVPQFLSPMLAIGLAIRARHLGLSEALLRPAIFLLAQLVWIAPWTFRNAEVYGRFVPIASSLGENAYVGLNATYRNFDLNAYTRSYLDEPSPLAVSRAWFVATPATPGWERADEILNTPDRMDENLRRGLAFARAEPGWLLRSRLKKLADLVVPTSFFLRRLGLRGYAESPLEAPGLRHAAIAWALASELALIPLAIAGGALLRLPRGCGSFIALGAGYFAATALLVSMSRFRVPLLPFAIPLAAASISGSLRAAPASRARAAAAAMAFAALGFLWWVDWPELRLALDFAWRLRTPS
jgi:hypothetical protein